MSESTTEVLMVAPSKWQVRSFVPPTMWTLSNVAKTSSLWGNAMLLLAALSAESHCLLAS